MSYQGDDNSHRGQIEALEIGESFARARRYDGDLVSKDLLSEASRGLRLATQPTVHRVAKRTGHVFTIEAGEIRTLSRDVIVVLVVTRIE